MNLVEQSQAEALLRNLAAGDEASLRSVLSISPARVGRKWSRRSGGLPTRTCALVHIAALLATGGSTTSLRWAVELAAESGSQPEEIVDVLVTMAAVLGAARVVAAAPRLALAIGYDIEVQGWDGY